jgi:hypothetical protein
MKQKTKSYGIYEVDHTRFGGVICQSDFNTDCRGKDNINGSYIASRIEADRKREEKLYKSVKNQIPLPSIIETEFNGGANC